MASAKELKDRIKAVQETKKITGAMYLISSTKLRRAKQDFAQTRPYFDSLRSTIGRVFSACGEDGSRYFRVPESRPLDGARGVLVITADKGLAGAYNLNVIREAERLLDEREGSQLFVVGDYGRRYFAQHRPGMVYLRGAQSPTADAARTLCTQLLDRYDSAELSELFVVYTDMKNSLTSTVRSQRVLPLEPDSFAQDVPENQSPARLEFVPSADEVIRGVIRSYLSGFLYAAALDSFCSEQNARVAAMDSANMNAAELLGDLSLQLNRSRQAAITQEITEISAGAQAQKNKKKGGARA